MKATVTESQLQDLERDVKDLLEKAQKYGVPLTVFAASDCAEDESRTKIIFAAAVESDKNEAAHVVGPVVEVLHAYSQRERPPKAALLQLAGIGTDEVLGGLMSKLKEVLGNGPEDFLGDFLKTDCGNPDCEVHHPKEHN